MRQVGTSCCEAAQ